MFKKSLYVQQLDEADCGAAALAMILRYYDSDFSLSVIKDYAQTDKNGTTALGLLKAAEKLNFSTRAIKTDMSFFNSSSSRQLTPFIAHINKNNGFLHYVVILEIHKDFLLVADPDPNVKITRINYTEFNKIWSGVALFMYPKSNYIASQNNPDSLWRTAKILLSYKRIIAIVILLTFLSTIITIFGTMFLQTIVDNIVPKKSINMLSIVSLGLIVAYLFHGIFTFFEGYFSTVLSQHLSEDILLNYINHLLKLPISFFEKRKTGELISRLNDASNIINTLARTAITAVLNIGTLLIIGIFLITINFKLFSLALISVPVYLIIIFSFTKLFDKWNNKVMEKNAILSSQLIESLSGIITIKSLNAESKIYQDIQNKFENSLHSSYTYSILTIAQESIKGVVIFLINLIILFWGAILTIQGRITIGQLIAFNAMMGYFLHPIEEIIDLQDEIQTAKTANTRINQIIFSPIEKPRPKSVTESAGKYCIQFHDASFEYKYGQPTICNIDLSIPNNSSLAIVGLSGSGKSTLAKLLVNFYYPTSGSILINGKDSHTLDSKSLREYINYVPQTPYIFSGSIADNILLGVNDTGVSREAMITAAKLAEVHNDIVKLPNGYDTQLSGDNSLSGGQLQRIAIARSLVCKSKIIIFDESTSNLDLLTEKKVLDNILSIKNKTFIFIAHRLSIAKKVNQVIVMSAGKIIEEGSHEELMRLKKNYYQLWNS